MSKPNEPVADTSAVSKLRSRCPITLQDLFHCPFKYSAKTEKRCQLAALAWSLARTRNWSQGCQVRFGRFAGIDTGKRALFP
jgi:hypothetical protein